MSTSIDSNIYLLPAADDGSPHSLYINNSNVVVVRDVVTSRTDRVVDVESITVQVFDGDESLHGPTDAELTDDVYVLHLPHDLAVTTESVLTLRVTIVGVDDSVGQWYLPLESTNRDG